MDFVIMIARMRREKIIPDYVTTQVNQLPMTSVTDSPTWSNNKKRNLKSEFS